MGFSIKLMKFKFQKGLEFTKKILIVWFFRYGFFFLLSTMYLQVVIFSIVYNSTQSQCVNLRLKLTCHYSYNRPKSSFHYFCSFAGWSTPYRWSERATWSGDRSWLIRVLYVCWVGYLRGTRSTECEMVYVLYRTLPWYHF